MPRSISLGTREQWAAQSVADPPVVLLEITHPKLNTPARVAAGNDDRVLATHTYTAMGIEVMLPDEGEAGLPRARVAIVNVGKELMRWVEASNGGRGAQVRMMICLRQADGSLDIEWEATLRVASIEATPLRLVFELGYTDLLRQPAVATRFDPQQAPGLF